MQTITEIKQNPGRYCKTLVIDTADWAERMCVRHICEAHGKENIEQFGYGSGWTILADEFGKLLNLLTDVKETGTHVVVVAHAQIRKFELPNEFGSYDKYELKLGKKTSSYTAPMLKEWADMVLFCNYKTMVVQTDKDGKKHKAQGGKRVMYTTHNSCWDAKNRDDLPDELPLDYAAIAHLFTEEDQAEQQPIPESVETAMPEQPVLADETPDISVGQQITDYSADVYQSLDPRLLQLMESSGVSEKDIREAGARKGFFPVEMPITNYPQQYVEQVLIAGWDNLLKFIQSEIWKLPF
jgi:hypothetical protein